MDNKVKELLDRALEGVQYVLENEDLMQSSGVDVLPSILDNLKETKENGDLHDLRISLDEYKRSNILENSPPDYNSIWFKEIPIKGKSEMLSKILDDLDVQAWEEIKKSS